jgi:hypothetical protein
MKLRSLVVVGITLWLAHGGLAAAQTLERTKTQEVGDKASFNWVLNNKAEAINHEWTVVSGESAQGVQTVAGKSIAVAFDSAGNLARGLCISNGQQCTFSPALKFADFPLEKGKKWTTKFTVTGETFTADVTQDRKVDKIEKVKVKAGEFQAAKVGFGGRIKGTDNKGNAFSGKEDGADWIAVVNGKVVVVKTEYRNSFGEKATVELASLDLK